MGNNVSHIRRRLGAELLKLYFTDSLLENIDKIPIKHTSKNEMSMRCCIYKDRAMYRYRIMALLGIDIENDDDEFKSLSDFAREALKREEANDKILTIIDIACASCQQNSYMVTDMCKGCVARPCESSCPKEAIQIINGRSLIDQDKCIACGKCEKVCPYNAIIYSPVPCEFECPVGAISRNMETGREEIDYEKCIYCGRCTRACPFGTIMECSELLDVARHLKEKSKPVIAMIAPSIVGQFPGDEEQVVAALKQLGFDYVYEVAYGADITARNEAEELVEKLESGQPILGTSCCPAYVESVHKHVKDFKPFVSHTKTPMAYTAELAKQDHPDAVTVFIGPCIAKKFEGINNDHVDYVLTYEELGSFFIAKSIYVQELAPGKYDTEHSTSEAQRFCIDGGVVGAVQYYLHDIDSHVEAKPFFINGLDKKGLNALRLAAKGKLPGNILECMSCEGGCLAGPGVIAPPTVSRKKLEQKLK